MSHEMTPHKPMHFVGGITPNEGLSWYSSEELFGQADEQCSFDCVSTNKMQFVRILSETKGENDSVGLFKKCLDTCRVYDVWWQNLIKETR